MESHQLEGKLKSLRLSGMLATLEARLAQARGGELGHLEFLEVLLEDEIGRREAKALSERLRRARFESAVTLEEFDFAYNSQVPAPLIRDLAALRFIERGESVLLYGPVGVGKTHVAQALGHLACRRGRSVLFAKTSRVLAELAGGRADGTWEQRLRRLARVDLLILDDFALRPFTGAQGDDFYELVSERSQHGSFILTANRSPKDWYEHWSRLSAREVAASPGRLPADSASTAGWRPSGTGTERRTDVRAMRRRPVASAAVPAAVAHRRARAHAVSATPIPADPWMTPAPRDNGHGRTEVTSSWSEQRPSP